MQLNGNSKLSESDWSQQAPVTAVRFRKLWHVPCPSRSLEPIRCHAFDGSAYNRSLGFLFPPCLFKLFEVVITRAGARACTWKGRLHYWWHVTPSSPRMFCSLFLPWGGTCRAKLLMNPRTKLCENTQLVSSAWHIWTECSRKLK